MTDDDLTEIYETIADLVVVGTMGAASFALAMERAGTIDGDELVRCLRESALECIDPSRTFARNTLLRIAEQIRPQGDAPTGSDAVVIRLDEVVRRTISQRRRRAAQDLHGHAGKPPPGAGAPPERGDDES